MVAVLPMTMHMARSGFRRRQNRTNTKLRPNLRCYMNGAAACPRDLNRAYFWQLLSIDGSNSERTYQLHDLARSMSAENVAAAERHVSEWRVTHPAKSPAEFKSLVGARTV